VLHQDILPGQFCGVICSRFCRIFVRCTYYVIPKCQVDRWPSSVRCFGRVLERVFVVDAVQATSTLEPIPLNFCGCGGALLLLLVFSPRPRFLCLHGNSFEIAARVGRHHQQRGVGALTLQGDVAVLWSEELKKCLIASWDLSLASSGSIQAPSTRVPMPVPMAFSKAVNLCNSWSIAGGNSACVID